MSKDVKVAGFLVDKELQNVNVVDVNGLMKVKGSVKANVVEVNGMAKINEDMEVNTAEINGLLKVKGSIKAKAIECNGYIITKNLETEDCQIDGKIKCEVLNCDQLNMKIVGNSSIDEIEAAKVYISIHRNKRKYLHSKMISADEIEIQNVKCDTLTGDIVVIGPNCVIKKVEYKTTLEIHPTSKVSLQEKL